MNHLIIRRAQCLQLGPAIDCPFYESCRLERFHNPIIVKVDESTVPSPSTSRQSIPFAFLSVRSNAALKVSDATGTDPKKMAFLERPRIGDVADIDVKKPVVIQITE